jgi:hypothetical protein
MNVSNILPGLAGQPSENLIRDLEPGSTYIKALKERFARATKADLDIISCYELRQTPQSELRADGSIVRSGVAAMNAPEATACLYWANEVRVPINENHSMIAKLADREGSAYHTVLSHLTNVVEVSAASVSDKFMGKMCTEDTNNFSKSSANGQLWSNLKGRRFCYQRVKRWCYSGTAKRIPKSLRANIEGTSCSRRGKYAKVSKKVLERWKRPIVTSSKRFAKLRKEVEKEYQDMLEELRKESCPGWRPAKTSKNWGI